MPSHRGKSTSGRTITKVPFGRNAAAPLTVESHYGVAMLTLKDTNGAPILVLGLDPQSGTYKVILYEGVELDHVVVKGLADPHRDWLGR